MSEYYYILDDMEKYFPNFNREEYEDKTYEELCAICRPYYETIPVDVNAWWNVNEPDEKLIYKDGLGRQIVFIRDEIYSKLFFDKEYPELKGKYNKETMKAYNAFKPMAISTHMSKSVLLPVMELDLKSVGVKIVLRYNFYNWNVSIESENDIGCDFKDVFSDDNYNYCYCEGFPADRKYGMYKDNHKKFTICIDDDYKLFTFMWLLADYLYKGV